jgi:prepilin-type N-terminal cleavage/methylation domain-containing protein
LNHIKSNRNSLQGFTLIEQIIVLALTAFVALISFTVILNFQQLLGKIQANSQIDRSLYHLHFALDNDFRNSTRVAWDGGLNVSKLSQAVRYDFEKQYIIRETKESIDTFRFAASDLKYAGVSGNDSIIEAFSFRISIGDQHYNLEFIKAYPENIIWELNNYGN